MLKVNCDSDKMLWSYFILRSLLWLFLHPFCLPWLSRESSISNIHDIIYKISCTLKKSFAVISNSTQGCCSHYTTPCTIYLEWNKILCLQTLQLAEEISSFLLRVSVFQCLVIRAKYIFFFRSAETKSQCVLSILNVNAEGVVNSSHYPVREVGSLKKYCEMNWIEIWDFPQVHLQVSSAASIVAML